MNSKATCGLAILLARDGIIVAVNQNLVFGAFSFSALALFPIKEQKMKIHQSFLAVCTLALLMSVPVIAGDMPGPGSSQTVTPPPVEGSKASSRAIISRAVPETAFYELMQVVLTVL